MNQDLLFHRYQEYQAYVGWVAADEEHVRLAADVLPPHLQPLIDDFYTEIDKHPSTRQVIHGSQTTIERLKGALFRWLQELLTGPHDREYVARRWQVGKRHLEVGLDQVYFGTAMARLRAGLLGILQRCWQDESEKLVPALISLNKLLDLDLTLIESAYQTEYLARIRRNEQLAKVGHVAGSVGHALRGPLNVMRTSAYYLRNAPGPNPMKLAEHHQRIERNMGVAQEVLEELSDFARMPPPRFAPFSVSACVEEALEQVSLPDNIQLTQNLPASLPAAVADRVQICRVFVSLLRRARDTMPNGGQLSVRGQPVTEAVEVAFEDSGFPLSLTTLAALAAPLSWSNVRILGMLLAVARAILDWNEGGLRAESTPGKGSKITIALSTSARATRKLAAEMC